MKSKSKSELRATYSLSLNFGLFSFFRFVEDYIIKILSFLILTKYRIIILTNMLPDNVISWF